MESKRVICSIDHHRISTEAIDPIAGRKLYGEFSEDRSANESISLRLDKTRVGRAALYEEESRDMALSAVRRCYISQSRTSKSMNISKVNLEEKFAMFDEYWTPKLVGELNGQYVKLAKLKGEFVWHSHEHEDEMFMIVKGRLIMEMRDSSPEVGPGEFIIVPRGVEHNPRTVDNQEVWLMLFEPKQTMHTGEVEHEKTVNDQQWI